MMAHTHSYQLFIRSKCSCCNEILKYVKSEKNDILVTNVDEQEYNLPFSLVIFPALILNEKLVSYGCEDIIERLKRA